MNSLDDTTLSAIRIIKNIEIEATPERVFEVLTSEVSLWWGEPYLRNKNSDSLVLEATLGGKFYESWKTGGMILGEVIEINSPEKISIRGSMGIEGLVLGVVTIHLEKTSNGTLLKLDHSIMGDLPSHIKSGFDLGWDNLIRTRLKAWVEQQISYGLGKNPPPGTPTI